MSPFGHVRMSSTGIRISYVQLAEYVPYRVPPRGPMCHVYIPTSLTRTPPRVGFDTICNTLATLGLAVVTPVSPLGSYTSLTDQPYSFLCTFVLTGAHPGKLPGRSPILKLLRAKRA
jgi:hypothetical protein